LRLTRSTLTIQDRNSKIYATKKEREGFTTSKNEQKEKGELFCGRYRRSSPENNLFHDVSNISGTSFGFPEELKDIHFTHKLKASLNKLPGFLDGLSCF
jgi:hypothetical protein